MNTTADTHWRTRLGDWIEGPIPTWTIVGLICLNAITLGLETSTDIMARFGEPISLIGSLVLGVFVVEIALKLVAWGPRFFRSGWNIFDFLIVTISLVPASGPLAVLRTLRILRVLRLLSMITALRTLVEGLLRAIPGIGWIAVLLLLVFYVFGVMGTSLFSESFPQWFGSVGGSMFSLFQIMTLESWSMGIARPVMEVYSWAWLYFVSFILVCSFTVLNLFIGLIVSTMQSLHWEEEEEKRTASEDKAHRERVEVIETLRALDKRVIEMERMLREQGKLRG